MVKKASGLETMIGGNLFYLCCCLCFLLLLTTAAVYITIFKKLRNRRFLEHDAAIPKLNEYTHTCL